MSEWVSDCWSNLHTKDIWNFWDTEHKKKSLVNALTEKQGVVNDQPLLEYMTRQMASKGGAYGEGRVSIVASTSYQDGEEVRMST